jgi:predicted Zn-dependent protease
VKSFRKAVAVLPSVPRFRADLAQALLFAGEPGEAVYEATVALQGYAAGQIGEAAEKRSAMQTAGRALRAHAEAKFAKRLLEDAIADMRRAAREMEESLAEEPDEAEGDAVRAEISAIRDRLGQWEEIWRGITGMAPSHPESVPEAEAIRPDRGDGSTGTSR